LDGLYCILHFWKREKTKKDKKEPFFSFFLSSCFCIFWVLFHFLSDPIKLSRKRISQPASELVYSFRVYLNGLRQLQESSYRRS
jgi:hypothetical protein